MSLRMTVARTDAVKKKIQELHGDHNNMQLLMEVKQEVPDILKDVETLEDALLKTDLKLSRVQAVVARWKEKTRDEYRGHAIPYRMVADLEEALSNE